MRTPEEIKKALECSAAQADGRCEEYVACVCCPLFVEDVGLEDITACIQQLEAQVPKWISVEERLPERNQRVVVTDGKRAWDYGQFNGLAFCFEKDNPNPREWNWKKHTVRHVEWWMPKETALPEPPKEG